jgi:hypothetical protein
MDFNLANDLDAANVIMESKIELWQIPLGTYTRMAVSFYELHEKVKPCGEIGEYLFTKICKLTKKNVLVIWMNRLFWLYEQRRKNSFHSNRRRMVAG